MAGKYKKRGGKNPKLGTLGTAAVILVLLFAVLWQRGYFDSSQTAEGICEFHFVDVGQGDCSAFISDGACLVVDAGPKSSAQATANYLKSRTDKVDYMILTHPDEDHIGGAVTVLNAVEVENVIMSDAVKDTKVFNDLLDALEQSDTKVLQASPGDSYEAGDIEFTLLAPIGSFEDWDDYNEYSVVTRVQYGKTSVLVMGDAEKGAEKKLLEEYGNGLSSDVLKLGHHGSSTSTGEEFFKAVSPDFAVISCGKNNTYGHPHKETLKLLQRYGVTPMRTDKDGTVVLISDGKSIVKK